MTSNIEGLYQKEIAKVLIGDNPVIFDDKKEYYMPYLRGSDIHGLFDTMNINKTAQIGWSRWEVMADFIESSIESKCLNQSLTKIFNQIRLNDYPYKSDNLEENMDYVVSQFINHINLILYRSHIRLEWANERIKVVFDDEPLLDYPTIKDINSEQIMSLMKRCEIDLTNGDYDSVLTKTRSMLEEVFIYIIGDEYDLKEYGGKIEKQFQKVLKICNINKNNIPHPIIDLVSSLNSIVGDIAKLRNDFSESHGHGNIKVNLSKAEIVLVINSSITVAEYILSIYEFKSSLNQRTNDTRISV